MIEVNIPGSKSITNRALLLAALAGGKSALSNFSTGDDTRFMIGALRDLGICIKKTKSRIEVHGSNGLFIKNPRKIYCGNAGTAVRFLTAALAAQQFPGVITGDKRMQERPIKDLLDALRRLGAEAYSINKNKRPPVFVKGPLIGGNCSINGNISSQFLSGLLMASPFAKKDVTINVNGDLASKPYVDLTIKIMEKFGVRVERNNYKKFHIKAGQKYLAANLKIEGDASSASYFWAISRLTNEKITIRNIPRGSIQPDAKFIEIIKKMRPACPAQRWAAKINCSDFPDSAMTLAVLSAFTKGKTELSGLGTLRVKECDRLHALACELRKINCKVKELKNGLVIYGDPEKLKPARIKTYNDHRMAMCFAVAGVALPGIEIENPKCVNKTYPQFWNDWNKIKKILAQKNIVLSGMRGSGKTKLGEILAKRFKRRFIDTDELIEKTAKKPISGIVRQNGWDYFRKLEKRCVKRLKNAKNSIIATGGGTLMDSENVKILKQNGKIIFLSAPLAILKKRLKDKNDRPSLLKKRNFLHELGEIYKSRKKQYLKTADLVIDGSRNTSDSKHDLNKKADEIIRKIPLCGKLTIS